MSEVEGVQTVEKPGIDPEALAEELAGIVAPSGIVRAPADLLPFSVGEWTPPLVVAPKTPQEVAAVVRLANSHAVSAVVCGAGTKQSIGDYLPPPALAISTAGLRHVIEIDTGNQTVQVGGGARLLDLQRELKASRLRLPLDPDDCDEATVGGTIAANASGPLRLRFGTTRDYLLGVLAVTPSGKLVRAGGKTVKDVAGYDLKKLMIGAWGTLGILVEASLRLLPLPEVKRAVIYEFPALAETCSFTGDVLRSSLLPAALEVLDPHARRVLRDDLELGRDTDDAWLALIALEGIGEDVAFQETALQRLAHDRRGVVLSPQDDNVDRIWRARRWVRRRLSGDLPAPVWLKALVPLRRVEAVLSAARQIEERLLFPLGAVAHAGNGVVYLTEVAAERESLNPGVEQRAVAELNEAVVEAGGRLVLERAPAAVRAAVPAGERPEYRLMREIKDAFDPPALLNRGRLSWIGL